MLPFFMEKEYNIIKSKNITKLYHCNLLIMLNFELTFYLVKYNRSGHTGNSSNIHLVSTVGSTEAKAATKPATFP